MHRLRTDAAGTLAVVALALLTWWVIEDGGFFRVDDYHYFHDSVGLGGTSKAWLTSVYYQHFAPLHRLMFGLGKHATVRSWDAILLFEVALLGVALASFAGCLRMLFGAQRHHLLVIAVVASSLYLAIPLAWPSAGLQGLPDVAAGTTVLYCFLRALRDRRAAWAWFAAVALGIGLLFYIRPLLTVGVLVLVRFLFLQDDLRPAAILRGLRRDRWLWLPIVLVVAGYLAYILHRGVLTSAPQRTLPVDQIPRLLGNFFFGNLIPAVAGLGPQPFSRRGPPGAILAVVMYAVILGVLVMSFRHKRSAWRGWLFVLAVIGASLVLVIQGRLAELGPDVGFDLRYYTHLPWLIALGVLFVASPGRTLDLHASTGAAPWRHGRLLMVLAVLVVGSNLVTGTQIVRNWQGSSARHWVETSVGSIERLPRPQVLPEGTVPGYVTTFSGDQLRSYLFPVLGLTPDAVTSQAVPTARIGDDGTATPVHFVARTAVDGKRCFSKPVDLVAPKPLSGLIVVVATGGEGVPGVRVPASIDTGQGFGDPSRALDPSSDGRSAFNAEVSGVRGVRLAPAAGTSACVDRLELGEMLPGDR